MIQSNSLYNYLRCRVNEIKGELAQQIRADFEESFQGPQAKVKSILIKWKQKIKIVIWFLKLLDNRYRVFPCQYGQVNQAQLAEACLVVNVLDPKVKKDLMGWFIKLQLSEYMVLFAENQDVSEITFSPTCDSRSWLRKGS